MFEFQSSVTQASRLFNHTNESLKPGQILFGKVDQIYPDQIATVVLAGRKVTAQLQTSIHLNQSYWFQVQSLDRMLRLKVLVGKPITKRNQIEALLDALDLPSTKGNQTFLTNVVNQGLPLDHGQIKQAITLLNEAGNGTVAERQHVILDMIRRQLPLQPSIFNVLDNEQNSTDFSSLITSGTIAISQEDEFTKPLVERMSLFTKQPLTTFKTGLIKEVEQSVLKGDTWLHTILQKAGVIPVTLRFEEWQKIWIVSIRENHQTTDGIKTLEIPPFNQSIQSIKQALINLFQSQIPVAQQKKIQFSNIVNQLEYDNSIQPDKLVNHQVLQTFIPFLNVNVKMLLNEWMKNGEVESLQAALPHLKQMADKQLTTQLEKSLVNLILKDNQTPLGSWKEVSNHFLLQLKHYLYFFGISHERDILQGIINEHSKNHEQSLKSLLLQVIKMVDTPIPPLESLLHSINRMQLFSYHEDDYMVYGSLQLPADRLGLKGDIKVDINSRKDSAARMDSDYCQIIFHLHLEHIGETVVHMSVQKRLVNVNIYNNRENLRPVILKVKPLLKIALEKNNYQLSSVQLKTQRFDSKNKQTLYNDSKPYYQGVDFKV